ncbi:hypothetical protein N7510_005252 [Penicillium lagena]|uniref:uncharacterized protein n=1 Tax=Penicillium lagena TaxID=94218 RepID=UPI002541DCF3|nr:uncharacterized protein N7510_005252 [Penicillium lagena]KAJ5612058.1 hypothetical protein N7510_005252 [Penicillium lagena]
MAGIGSPELDGPLPKPAVTNNPPENTLESEPRKHRPPYKIQSAKEFGPVKWRGHCLCGKVSYVLKRDKPLESKYCHCRVCQVNHGAPFQWAFIIYKHEMSFLTGAHGVSRYETPHESQMYGPHTKVSCSSCHTPIMDECENVCLIFPQLIEITGSNGEQRKQREVFKPKCHVFYESRMEDILDGLPKWREIDGTSGLLDDYGNQIPNR